METPEQKEKIKKQVLKALEGDRQKLLLRQPFIGSVMMQQELIPVFDSRVETACTDGVHIFVSCRFYASLTTDERLFVLAHEVWHTVLMHFQRRMWREHELFNIASDLEIHFVLHEEHFDEPFVLPHDPAWAKKSAEEIYDLLKKNPERSSNGKESANIRKIRSDGGMDRHLDDSDIIPPPDEQPEEFDSDFAPVAQSSVTERIRRIVIQSAQRVERMQGSLPCAMKMLLERMRKCELRWQEILKQFVTSAFGGERHWLPPARRYIGSGLYLPSRRDKCLQAVVVIDTSGSTLGDMPEFFGELNGLLRAFGSYELTVIQSDAAVQKVEKFNSTAPFSSDYSFEISGGGGTDFRPAFDYIQKNIISPNVVLYITDGYGIAPEVPPPYPVMWVLTHDGETPAPWGRAIKLKEHQD